MSGSHESGRLRKPTLLDVLDARKQIRMYLDPSPLRNYSSLDRLAGAKIWVKHENLLPTGAFKVRGGINLVSRLDADTRDRGVVAASTGNHGQSVAYAARLFDVNAVICAPTNSNPVKVEAMRDLGAEVILVGKDYDEAREHCEQLAVQLRYRYIHSGDEPDLIAGVATHTLEILEERPDVEIVIVPVGGGSGAAGACVVAKALNRTVQVIAVQSASAPTAHDSWRAGQAVERPNTTIADGLATRVAFQLPRSILRDNLDDFVLVSDEELLDAVAIMIEKTRTLVEPAGAAALAATLGPLRQYVAGRTVAILCSGANLSPAHLRAIAVRTTTGSE